MGLPETGGYIKIICANSFGTAVNGSNIFGIVRIDADHSKYIASFLLVSGSLRDKKTQVTGGGTQKS